MLRVRIAMLLAFLSVPCAALAIPVTYQGQTYDVTRTEVTSYDDVAALLQSQVWWGNFSAAIDFTNQVNSQLGGGNWSTGQYGPQFAWGLSGSDWLYSTAWNLSDNQTYSWGSNIDYNVWSFAIATPVPEPGTLLLFSAGLLGIAFARRRWSKNT